MTIYLNLYIYFYVINLICIHYILKNIFSEKANTLSIPYILHYILNLSNYKQLIFSLILALTGIPPFIMFFFKFNYLIHILSKLSYIYLYLIVFIIFFNMIFYIQIFLFKNLNINNNYKKLKKKKLNFKIILAIYFFLFFLFTSIFFVLDIYFISLMYL